MDNDIPITGLDDLTAHMDALIADPSTPLEAKLFDDIELQLTDSNTPPLLTTLLPRLVQILHTTPSDPTTPASLTTKLLRPLSFSQITSLAPPESLIQALELPFPAANILAMTILHKAAAAPAEVAQLAAMQEVVHSFVRTWLGSSEVSVGEKGGRIMGDLLDVDCEFEPPARPQRQQQQHPLDAGMPTWHDMVLRKEKGSGALWRRMFADQQIYTLILDLLAGRHEDTDVSSTSDAEERKKKARQLTLAQGRILRILPRLAALDLNKVARSEVAAPMPGYYMFATAATTNGHNTSRPNGRTTNYNSDILTNGVGVEEEEQETQMPLPAPPKHGQGLLHFAALRMVDRNDVLMHLSLIDFFEAFVGLMRVTPHSEDKVNIIKDLLREAVADDQLLRESLERLPDRTVDEERDELRGWVREVMPVGGDVDVVMR
ncbi:hypothetical protein NEUTE1DRAFT_78008 [Neurospora tetrasperma FGSC 2508]|uniref:DNA mismatch repair protein HSM3 N-terminal domain-containing protein n=1 Tax=Neurospora tetrasperma (strain FGSC 2508 / ATCC MYA-4615 / P0657) TaxID=510951 RepID=F8MGL0_NEUT8|nr:uncharacterized protein NEUTE1DRAFT_78008 [Neurospora tetrasperma FGSC 2508]EGO58632.1 hypothetical protein NEUTE1DRAFT_78008 [Neurospora tetrasperma FGSC 2508]EGZ72711.1 hypothetical protein NEUTE2DRAFT_149025 [Neurospora tetrasperma FGSC 2509]